jgi:hypothetical protein
METLRTIHPSATLFAAIFLALFLPFGQAVESCGSSKADFSVVEVLSGTVEPSPRVPDLPGLPAFEPEPYDPTPPIDAEDRRFADEVERSGWPFAALLVALAATGLMLTTLFRGFLWGTCSLLIAIDSVLLMLAVNLGDLYAGGHLVFWGSSFGALVALFLAFARWVGRRQERHAGLASPVTTPEELSVR